MLWLVRRAEWCRPGNPKTQVSAVRGACAPRSCLVLLVSLSVSVCLSAVVWSLLPRQEHRSQGQNPELARFGRRLGRWLGLYGYHISLPWPAPNRLPRATFSSRWPQRRLLSSETRLLNSDSIRTPFGAVSPRLGVGSGSSDDHRGRPRLRTRVFLPACLSACLLRRLRLLRAACATSRSLQLRLLRSETRLLGAESPQIRLLRLLTSDGVACVGCATCELVLRIGTTVVGRSVTS